MAQLTTARVGIVGGGPAGALCAQVLREHGVSAVVLDKGRRPGGRLSTRTYEAARFDHGAQFMTVRDEAMRARLSRWVERGVVALWEGAETDLGTGRPTRQRRDQRWVGVPTMSALVEHLLRGVACRFFTRVTHLRDVDGEFEVTVDAGRALRFDRVVVAVPAPQAATLLGHWGRLSEAAAAVRFAPCWAAMAELPRPLEQSWICARVRDEQIAWIARNHTKPGRPDHEAWVVHATAEWSRNHLEETRETAAQMLVPSALRLVDCDQRPTQLRAHRWRYALVEEPVGQPCLFEANVGLCGDGLLGGRIGSALVSGAAMAERILQSQ